MGRIDDPFDAAKSQYPELPENTVGELALRIGASVVPLAGIVSSVREYYSQRAINERLGILVDAVNSKANATDAKVDAINLNLESGRWAEGIARAIDESIRTTDAEKVKRFGAILGNSLGSSEDSSSPEDAAEFIKTVSQLSERDIQTLDILYSVNANIMRSYTNLHDPNPFTERKLDILQRANEAKLEHDDFYSSCKRLEGFGLAIELPRNSSRMNPSEYCFRPTRRGEKLFYLLKDGPSKR